MAPPITKIIDLLDNTLGALNDLWAEFVVDGASELPELQYVSDGEVAWDGCEVLAVSWNRTAPTQEGDPSLEAIQPQAVLAGLRFVVVDVALLRCVPTITQDGDAFILPPVEDVAAAARVIAIDAQCLTNAILAASKAKRIPGCNELALEGCTAAGPEGGMAGSVLRFRASTI